MEIEWEKAIRNAVSMANEGNTQPLELIVKFLSEADTAKSILREKGYGVLGQGLLASVLEVPDHIHMTNSN